MSYFSGISTSPSEGNDNDGGGSERRLGAHRGSHRGRAAAAAATGSRSSVAASSLSPSRAVRQSLSISSWQEPSSPPRASRYKPPPSPRSASWTSSAGGGSKINNSHKTPPTSPRLPRVFNKKPSSASKKTAVVVEIDVESNHAMEASQQTSMHNRQSSISPSASATASSSQAQQQSQRESPLSLIDVLHKAVSWDSQQHPTQESSLSVGGNATVIDLSANHQEEQHPGIPASDSNLSNAHSVKSGSQSTVITAGVGGSISPKPTLNAKGLPMKSFSPNRRPSKSTSAASAPFSHPSQWNPSSSSSNWSVGSLFGGGSNATAPSPSPATPERSLVVNAVSAPPTTPISLPPTPKPSAQKLLQEANAKLEQVQLAQESNSGGGTRSGRELTANDLAAGQLLRWKVEAEEGPIWLQVLAYLLAVAAIGTTLYPIVTMPAYWHIPTLICAVHTVHLCTLILLLELRRLDQGSCLDMRSKIRAVLCRYWNLFRLQWGRGVLYATAGSLNICIWHEYSMYSGLALVALGVLALLVGSRAAFNLDRLKASVTDEVYLWAKFDAADLDGDELVDMDGLGMLLRSLGLDVNDSFAHRAFAEMEARNNGSTNRRGYISFEQFKIWWFEGQEGSGYVRRIII